MHDGAVTKIWPLRHPTDPATNQILPRDNPPTGYSQCKTNSVVCLHGPVRIVKMRSEIYSPKPPVFHSTGFPWSLSQPFWLGLMFSIVLGNCFQLKF